MIACLTDMSQPTHRHMYNNNRWTLHNLHCSNSLESLSTGTKLPRFNFRHAYLRLKKESKFIISTSSSAMAERPREAWYIRMRYSQKSQNYIFAPPLGLQGYNIAQAALTPGITWQSWKWKWAIYQHQWYLCVEYYLVSATSAIPLSCWLDHICLAYYDILSGL